MKRLIVAINVFNEAEHIGQAIESVLPYADEVHVWDGAYADYPHQNPHSTDGTVRIAKSYKGVIVHECTQAWNSQIEKRTAMFSVGQKGDYFLKLDGDEYVTNPERLKDWLKDQVGWVWTLSNLYPEPIMTARLFKWSEGIHYAGRHHWLYSGSKHLITSDQNSNPMYKHVNTDLRIMNYRASSTPKRILHKRRFLSNRNPLEQQYRDENGVYGKMDVLIPHKHRAGRPQSGLVRVYRESKKPSYSFTLMFSRVWAIPRYIKMLEGLWIPDNTEAIVLIDSRAGNQWYELIDAFNRDRRFVGLKVIITKNNPLPERSQVSQRRRRIVSNWNKIIAEIKAPVVLTSEDDSLPVNRNTYRRLLKVMAEQKADLVQANIIGRWSLHMCPAWKILDKDGEPCMVYPEAEKSRGVERVQGCGWYCFVATTSMLRNVPMYLDSLTPLGPDLRWGYEATRMGFKLLHDWESPVEHFGQNFSLIPGRTPTQQKLWIKEDGKWKAVSFNPKVVESYIN